MDDNIIIRAFAPNDKQHVTAFFDQMGEETRAFFDRGGCNRVTAMKYFDGTAENTDYFLAEQDGTMCGYVFLKEMCRSIPWLGIAVAEELKGKGLGRRLLQYAAEHARQKGKGGILLITHPDNLRAQRLYEHMGYERLGTHLCGEYQYILRF